MPYIMYLRISNMFRYTEVMKYEYRMISNSSIVQMDKNENVVTKKLNELMAWYEEVTGLNEVHAAQNRVLEEEKKLAAAQEHRRDVNKLITAIQAKLRELHTELDSTPRGEDRYVSLITREHSLLKEERRLTSEMQQYEREERDYFTALSSAVKDSHEKERAQAQRTKYWSIIGSIIGTVIGIAGSSINNHFKFKKFKNVVKETVEGVKVEISKVDSGNLPQLLHKQEEQLSQIVAQIKAMNVLPSRQSSHVLSDSGSADKMDKVLRLLDHQQAVLQNRFKELEVLIKRSLASAPIENVRKQSTQDSVVNCSATEQPSLSTAYPSLQSNIAVLSVALGVVVLVAICSCCYR